jgi:RimJ/RimL family protein N-acetyltransferase
MDNVFSRKIPRFETDRLILREIAKSDAQAIFDIFSDEEITHRSSFSHLCYNPPHSRRTG